MSKIGPFLVGAMVGAGAALLLAPQTGEQTRALVTEKANAVAGEAKDFGAGLPGSAQDFLKSAQAKGQEFASSAQTRVKEATGQPAEVDGDELRQKIEAARQRIAAQVMENAEQAKAVDIDAAKDAVVEAVEDVADKAKHAAGVVAEVASEAVEAAGDVAEDASGDAAEDAAE